MPLKASIGLSRKIGQENYGSLGANCQLEIELDASLVGDAEAFHDKIRRLYTLAHQAVTDQLEQQASSSRRNNNSPQSPNNSGNNGHRQSPRSTQPSDETPASNKQVKFLLDLARQQHRLSLAQTNDKCAEIVGVDDVYRLTKNQASIVIDHLTSKSGTRSSNGNGRRA